MYATNMPLLLVEGEALGTGLLQSDISHQLIYMKGCRYGYRSDVQMDRCMHSQMKTQFFEIRSTVKKYIFNNAKGEN